MQLTGKWTHFFRNPDNYIDVLAPCLAVLGLVGALIPDYLQMHTAFYAGNDFKILFIAVRSMLHGYPPYAIDSLAQSLTQDHIALPQTWFGRMPVYPPFTLALLAPMGFLSTATATWMWFLFSAASLIVALVIILRRARDTFHVPRLVRLLMLGLFCAANMISFVLMLANVSILCSSCCIMAVYLRAPVHVRGVLLAVALLLKPHLAIWLWFALLVPTATRKVAAWAAADATLFVIFSSLVFLVKGNLLTIWQGYRDIMAMEMAKGASMAAATRDVLAIGAQITSAWSLSEYFSGTAWHIAVATVVMGSLLGTVWLAMRSMRIHTQADNVALAGVFIAAGMVVTYHRDHDYLIMLMVLPLLFSSWKQQGMLKCIVLLLLAELFSGPAHPEDLPLIHGTFIGDFLFYRQIALAAFLLLPAMLGLAFAIRKTPGLQNN